MEQSSQRGGNLQMEELINTLLQQDAEAQKKLLENQQRRQQMADQMTKVKEDMLQENLDQANKRIENIRSQYQAEFDEESKQLEDSYQQALDALKTNFETNREGWIQAITERCLQ